MTMFNNRQENFFWGGLLNLFEAKQIQVNLTHAVILDNILFSCFYNFVFCCYDNLINVLIDWGPYNSSFGFIGVSVLFKFWEFLYPLLT